MKTNIKTLGIDDGPFDFHDPGCKEAMLVGVVMRSNNYLEGVLKSSVEVDGTNATRIVVDMVCSSRHHPQLKAIFLDGISVGGFNVLDIERIYELTGVPVLALTRREPDFQSIKAALKKHFQDWELRWSLVTRGKLHRFQTQTGDIFGKLAGLEQREAQELLEVTTMHGQIPEPVRAAHLIASGIITGDSSGRM